MLPIEGRLYAKIKVSSRLGVSMEKGESSAIRVSAGRTFLLSKVITQAIFGHLKKKNFDSYQYLNNNSGDQNFIDNLNIQVNITDYHYLYPKYSGVFRYKTINVKHKRYVQKFKKQNGKYVFNGRFKVKYDSRKKLDKTSKEYKMS